jgi:hypothetical protein
LLYDRSVRSFVRVLVLVAFLAAPTRAVADGRDDAPIVVLGLLGLGAAVG